MHQSPEEQNVQAAQTKNVYKQAAGNIVCAMEGHLGSQSCCWVMYFEKTKTDRQCLDMGEGESATC